MVVLIRAGIAVYAFNQRNIGGILAGPVIRNRPGSACLGAIRSGQRDLSAPRRSRPARKIVIASVVI
jgi:hypothetical protein